MRIAIVGGGYVGLVSGACLAEHNHDVIIVESDPDKVKQINQGVCPIHEAGLEQILANNIGKRLHATNDIKEAVTVSDATFIAVGTPFDGNEIDLSQIRQAAAEIGDALKTHSKYHLVVVKSTVVPGTTDNTVTTLLQQHSGKALGDGFGVGMNPEFLKEGTAVADFMSPDRIVLGGNDKKAQDILANIYASFATVDKVRVNNTTAELIKYASNSLLATLISFTNEIGNLCTQLEDTDITSVMQGVCLDQRLSPIDKQGNRTVPGIVSYLAAGCGFGGSCFPKDVNALRAFADQQGVGSDMLSSVIDVNNNQPAEFIDLLQQRITDLEGKTIAVLGLAFKPETDDTRESPAIKVIQQLEAAGANVITYDPIVKTLPPELDSSSAAIADSMDNAVKACDAVMLITAWDEFKSLSQSLAKSGKQPWVLDGRRILNPADFKHYAGIGLGPISSSDSDNTGGDVASAA